MNKYIDLSSVIDVEPPVDEIWNCISDTQFIEEFDNRYIDIIKIIIKSIDNEDFIEEFIKRFYDIKNSIINKLSKDKLIALNNCINNILNENSSNK